MINCYFNIINKMDDNDDDNMKTEIIYRSVMERLYSDMKKELENEDDKKSLKIIKDVKNIKIIFSMFI